jgi:Asp-tRNA(Asn)/Glu-tRNA(Gln) amidotransferase A subunit family amidase
MSSAIATASSRDLLTLGAAELSKPIRHGEVSAAGVVRVTLGTIIERRPRINAFISVTTDQAMADLVVVALAVYPGSTAVRAVREREP